MGLKSKNILLAFLIVISFAAITHAAWEGPVEVVSLTWGQGAGQVGLKSADTADIFPTDILIALEGKIVVGDIINNRVIIFNTDGSLQKTFAPIGMPVGVRMAGLQGGFLSGGRLLIKLGDKYQIYNYNGDLLNQFTGVATYIQELVTLSDDTIVVYKSDTKSYSLYSPTGALIRTTTERPLELGKVKEKKTATGYTYTVQYPDITNPNTVKTYTINLPGLYRRFIRDNIGNINVIAGKEVRKFDSEGNELGILTIPEDERRVIRPGGGGFEAREQIIVQYGETVIAPNGDVYTWKRTPTTYSIIKWTWR